MHVAYVMYFVFVRYVGTIYLFACMSACVCVCNVCMCACNVRNVCNVFMNVYVCVCGNVCMQFALGFYVFMYVWYVRMCMDVNDGCMYVRNICNACMYVCCACMRVC